MHPISMVFFHGGAGFCVREEKEDTAGVFRLPESFRFPHRTGEEKWLPLREKDKGKDRMGPAGSPGSAGLPGGENMISFRELTEADQAWITACRDPGVHPFTALSFTSLFSWRRNYGLTVGGEPDFFVIRSLHDGAYYGPCGDPEKCRSFVRETLREEKHPHFLYLTKEQAQTMEQEGLHIVMRDDLSEYIYDVSSLALREGHHVAHSYKKKVHQFRNRIPYTVRPATAEDRELLTAIAESASLRTDFQDEQVWQTEMACFEQLELTGCVLETEDGRRAFNLGYPDHGDVFTLTMAKHEESLPSEVTAVMVCELAGMLEGRYRLVNMEEDLGLAGLRRAKLLYTPVDRLNVYEAIG